MGQEPAEQGAESDSEGAELQDRSVERMPRLGLRLSLFALKATLAIALGLWLAVIAGRGTLACVAYFYALKWEERAALATVVDQFDRGHHTRFRASSQDGELWDYTHDGNEAT